MRVLIIFLGFLALAGCENVDRDLWDQITHKPQEAPKKTVPSGSVPVTGKAVDYSEADPATLRPPSLPVKTVSGKGKGLYAIYCAVCHGKTGKSDTKVAEKMDLQPFDLTGDSTRELTDGEIFVKILASDTVMPKYRNELTDEEAWEITGYIRFLQRQGP